MTEEFRCLVVGIPGVRFEHAGVRPEEVGSIAFDQLNRASPLSPTLELVVAPLFCADFDALEMIEALGCKGFRGLLRIVAPKLPNRQIVLRELRSHAVRKGITLELAEENMP